jgi:hypothetical protein
MSHLRRIRYLRFAFFLGVLPLVIVSAAGRASDWRTASHETVGLAPDPSATPEPVVQVYAARAFGWRGTFGVHTWVAVKPSNATAYTVYEVTGWRRRGSGSAVAISQRAPDARWYGSAPELIADKRGEGVDGLIARVDRAAHEYPYAGEYTIWPGPNSNTFVAWVARAVPELLVNLPSTAIGKDYLGDRFVASAPSGSGFQFSLGGLLAFTASGIEGIELNILGLTFGIDPFDPAIKLPLLGRLGANKAVQ